VTGSSTVLREQSEDSQITCETRYETKCVHPMNRVNDWNWIPDYHHNVVNSLTLNTGKTRLNSSDMRRNTDYYD